MAWTGLTLTVEGRNALNQAQLAGRIQFKSIVVGDGAAPVNFRTLKKLVHQLYEITDIKVDMTEDECTVTADFPKVDYDYYFREIGIIVTTDEGDRLYVYDNCGEDAQYMVSSTGVETTKKRIRLSLAISDVAEITVSTAEILYVAYDEYEKTVEMFRQDLLEENERAEAAENSLTEKLQAENERAEAAENSLTEKLQAENERAEAAENSLTEKLQAENERAEAAENSLTEKIQTENERAEAAENSLTEKLKQESIRAENKENNLAENLQKEISRAKTAEETNRSNLTTHIVDKTNPHNVTKAQVGLGNVNNTSDADKPVSTAQQNALDSAYQRATGYTDRKIADLIDGAPETLDTLKEVADAIQTNKDVSTALDAAIGTKADKTTLDTHTTNGTIHITSTERTNWNDSNTKKHTHSNKGVLDKITQALLDNWNIAYTHISDAVKHITAAERTLWNTVSNKVDKVDGKGLSTNDYTTAEKNKLAGITAGANNYAHPTTSGNKHIPSGGSSGQILRWSADGTAAWGSDNNTTYSTATQSANGLLSAADKKKLDGISEGANKIIVDSALSSTSANPIQNKIVKSALDGKAASSHTHNYAGSSSAGGSANSAVKLDSSAGSTVQPVYFKDGKPTACTYSLNASVPSGAKFTDTTYSNMSAATASVAGKAGLVPAPAAGKQASFLRGDGTWATPTDTNTWRGITDSLTSTSTTTSLSAKAGKSLKDSIDTINGNLKQTTDGKFVLPNGLKICWGKSKPPNANGYIRSTIVNFPITFNVVPVVCVTKLVSNSYTECGITSAVGTITEKQFNVKAMYQEEALNNLEVELQWIAIGY